MPLSNSLNNSMQSYCQFNN